MKILQQQPVLVDIGPLDATMRLPMSRRLARGMRTVCDSCGRSITDEYFLVGVRANHQNLKFHERCIPESERKDVSSL